MAVLKSQADPQSKQLQQRESLPYQLSRLQMRANPRQTSPLVTTEPAWSKPKITDVDNSPHIPQETLILDEFVKPPGAVWGGGGEPKASALQAAKWPGLLCTCSSPGAASLVLHVSLKTVQGEGKANAKWYKETWGSLSVGIKAGSGSETRQDGAQESEIPFLRELG